MSRPFATKQGSYYLNVKVPLALRPLAKGQRVSLPVDGEHHTVVVSDKVVLSLRTKEAKVAKERFPLALNALNAFFETLGQPPQSLSRVQARALAGEIYKEAVSDLDHDDAVADQVEAHRDAFQAAADHYQGQGANEKLAELEAAIEMYDERAMLAWGLKHGDPLLSREELLEGYFGPMLDEKLAQYHLRIDAGSRQKLLNAADRMGQEFIDTAERRLKANDYRDPVAAELPAFTPPPRQATPSPRPAPRRSAANTVEVVFERWKEAHAKKRKPSTFRRYGPSLASFHAFWGERDVGLLSQDDVWQWALEREKEVGITARTINKNDLVAISSVLGWASTYPGKRLLVTNPAKGVSLEVESKTEKREKAFRDDEVAAILKAARKARGNPEFPRAAASRRWTAWICAYTGARIQEVCWLKREDIKRQDGMWVIHFSQTKTDVARTIPMHAALIEEGLLAFHEKAPEGFLFAGDKAQQEGSTRTPQEQRASELAEWVRKQVTLDKGLSPNHGWRHTFITRAEEAGIQKRFANAITGHNHKKDVSDGYFSARPKALKSKIDAYPRYELDTKEDSLEP
ncbi:tyrosine-type recombinase/integrase [Bosea sp. 124]|uniref:tyrosine-type recombinase/integrase n=1 Tax=Bosea sp. 124 TaxID=2135642 RepID=UPI0015E64DA8|nr:tyrosine-type recombinase/integrase [Bosea sp. 124]